MSVLLNRVRQAITSPTGTGGPLVLSSTAYSAAYQPISGAGGVDQEEYCYIIEESLDWEIQRGVWTSSGNTLARNTPILSSISGVAGTTKMSLTGAATIRVIMDADELGYIRQVRSVTGSSDTILDRMKGMMTIYNRSSAIAVALAAPSGNSFKVGWKKYVRNIGVGAVTITPSGATITSGGSGTSNIVLNQYDSAMIFSDGTNFHATVTRNPLWAGSVTLSQAQQAQAQGNIGAIGTGFANKFRNPGMDIWQRGTGSQPATTSGDYTADGWIVLPTGASCTALQLIGRQIGQSSLKVVGATSVSDVIIKQRIESIMAWPLAGKRVTVQATIYNFTGGSITPTLTVKHATATDNWGATATDVSAVNLQACPDSTITTIAYTFDANASSGLGLEVAFDFGNNFSTTSKYVEITSCDIRVTPGVPTGLNSNPPTPEFRPIALELAICQRYFFNLNTPVVSDYYALGVGFYPVTTAGYSSIQFPMTMRAAPTVVCHTLSGFLFGGTSNIVPSAVSITKSTIQSVFFTYTVAGAVAGQAFFILIAQGSSITGSAEL